MSRNGWLSCIGCLNIGVFIIIGGMMILNTEEDIVDNVFWGHVLLLSGMWLFSHVGSNMACQALYDWYIEKVKNNER